MNTLEKMVVGGILAGGIVSSAGCAKWSNQIAADGGLIGTYKAPYVVIKQSGGVITDVFKLPNAIIQSETGSDGWLFVDENGRAQHLGGDMKSIRFKSTSDPLWNCYKEYHMEFEQKPYQQLHANDSNCRTMR